MKTETVVKDRYADGANAREEALCCPVEYDAQYLKIIPTEVIERDYGCGDPSQYVKEGETVLDLGSGTGKICFIASQVVGPTGKVIGVDMTDDMLEVARRNTAIVAERAGHDNVEFRKGRIQDLALDLEALEASYNLAKLELDYTQIRASISGVVSERYVKLGNTVSISDPLFRVTSLDPLVAYVHVPEREFRQITADQPVSIDIDALSGPPIAATVTRVSPIVDPTTGTFKITVEIEGRDHNIKPGMFGRINIVYDVHENVLQIPRTAITDRAGELSVFVVKDGIGIKRSIKTGFSNDGMIEVTEGLADGERVITVGHVGLKNESKVVVINLRDDETDLETADEVAPEETE